MRSDANAPKRAHCAAKSVTKIGIDGVRAGDSPQPEVRLEGGDRLVLINGLADGAATGITRNVQRIDVNGNVIWTIHSDFDSEGHPFTQLHFDGGRLTAYRWDGGTYAVDLETGFATPLQLER